MIGVRRREVEFEKDAADVLLDRSFGNHELAGDRRVRPSFGHEGEHSAFPRGQTVERLCSTASADELPWVSLSSRMAPSTGLMSLSTVRRCSRMGAQTSSA